MPSDLLREGQVIYTAGPGAVTFGDAYYKSDVSSTPVYDRAGRTVTAVNHSLRIRQLIHDDSSTDTTMDTMKKILTTPGGALQMEGVGWGDVRVNLPNGQRDCLWGPKPRLLSWKNMGKRSAWVDWRVDF